MAGRILVIRGGAIGDFILTLPAIRLIREAFPEAHLEILGYQHILEIAENRFYADAIRSIEYAPMARLFHPTAGLSSTMSEYFAGFHQVVSYLFDPDGIFSTNLEKAGVKNLIIGPGKLDDTAHAAAQLAEPLVSLGLFLDDFGARVFPRAEDFERALSLLPADPASCIAMHPGSGSEKKNWPIKKWMSLIHSVTQLYPSNHIVLVGGEADQSRLSALREEFGSKISIIESQPLPVLAGFFARCAGFVGHDSGISHLAAASEARCVLLFGPTDMHVWAPKNKKVCLAISGSGDMNDIALESVLALIDDWNL